MGSMMDRPAVRAKMKVEMTNIGRYLSRAFPSYLLTPLRWMTKRMKVSNTKEWWRWVMKKK